MASLIADLTKAAQVPGPKAPVFRKATEVAADVLKDNSMREGCDKLVISFAHFRDSSLSEDDYNGWDEALSIVVTHKNQV